MFDPYHKWLAIPQDQRPPTYYQLLGVSPQERDADVIDEAALRQMAHVRAYQMGQHAALSQRILNEISQARTVLLNPDKRKAYDDTLAGASARATAISKPPSAPARRRADERGEPDDETHDSSRRVPSVRKPAGALPLMLIVAIGGGVVALVVVIVAVAAALWLIRVREPQPPAPIVQDGAAKKKSEPAGVPPKGPDANPAPNPAPEPSVKPPVEADGNGPRLVKGKAVPGAVAAFRDANRFFTFSGPLIKLRRLPDASQVASFSGHGERVLDLALSRDGKRLASTDQGKQIFVWDVDKQSVVKKIAPREVINCVAFSPDGRKLAGGGSRDVYLWDVDKASEEASYTGKRGAEGIKRVAFTPDGNQVVSGGQTFRVWDLRTNATSAQAGPMGGIMNFAIARQGDFYYLATSYSHLYRKTPASIQQLKDTSQQIWFVALGPDNERLVVGGPGMVGLADPETGALVTTLILGAGEWQPVVGPTARSLAATNRGRDESYLIEIK